MALTRSRLTALGIALAVVAALVAAAALREDDEPDRATTRLERELPLAASRVHTLLSSVASQLVGHEVTVRCWPPRAWRDVVRHRLVRAEFGGRAGIGSEREAVQLASPVCNALARLSGLSGGRRLRDAAFAVGVLSHGAMHVAYDAPRSEAGVECRGMQQIARAGRALGLPGRRADRLAAVYAAEVYPQRPARYRSPDCRNGGRLDARPRDPRWP